MNGLTDVSFVEVFKILLAVLPGIWFLSTRLTALSGKIDTLDNKLDNKVTLLDQKIDSKIELIDTKIKQYADREQMSVERMKAVEDHVRMLMNRVDKIERRE